MKWSNPAEKFYVVEYNLKNKVRNEYYNQKSNFSVDPLFNS